MRASSSLVLVGLFIAGTFAAPASVAAQPDITSPADRWRAFVTALPQHVPIEVRLHRGKALRGTLEASSVDGFTLRMASGETRVLRYQDTKIVKAAKAVNNWKPSTRWWIVIGVATAVLVTLAILMARGGR